MLPRERFWPDELLRWIEDTQDSNERAKRSDAKRRAALCASLPSLNRRCNTRILSTLYKGQQVDLETAVQELPAMVGIELAAWD